MIGYIARLALTAPAALLLASLGRQAGRDPAGARRSSEQDKNDKSKWIFHLRYGVKFHDGSDFNADEVIWKLDRYFKPDST